MSKTKLGKAPFPAKPKTSYHALDVSRIKKTRTPYKPVRVVAHRKYDELFSGIKEGDCFEVDGDIRELSALARALRAYLDRHDIKGIVRQASQTEDGIKRVWLLRVLRPSLKEAA